MRLASATIAIILLSSFLAQTNYPTVVKKGTEIIFRAGTSFRGDIRQGDKKEDVALFRELAKFLNKHKDWSFLYEVHIEQRGNDEANLKLTEIRAKNTVHSLEEFFGVSKGQLIPKGMGESTPIISTEEIAKMETLAEKEKAYSINRRTVIRALNKR
ncbi:MAG: OmpA family protein [Putridiphycobacter sp.]|nr:OmpA family protein [Putridiphycobacter sp.]